MLFLRFPLCSTGCNNACSLVLFHPHARPPLFRRMLGRGDGTYEVAADALRNWAVNSGRGARIELELEPPAGISAARRGATAERGLATMAQCPRHSPLWILNPCRVTYELVDHRLERSAGGWASDAAQLPCAAGVMTAVSYSTLRGHLLAGEERLSVCRCARTGEVYFDILSISRGSNPLVRAVFPLIRPMQRAFFNDQLDHLTATVRRHEALRRTAAPPPPGIAPPAAKGSDGGGGAPSLEWARDEEDDPSTPLAIV